MQNRAAEADKPEIAKDGEMTEPRQEEGVVDPSTSPLELSVDKRSFATKVVLGSETGTAAALLRCALRPAGLLYGALVLGRDKLYDFGFIRNERLPGPTISVGNLSAGGTGKTPMVEWVAGKLVEEGRRPAIISRGYGARVQTESGEVSEEAAMLSRNLADVPHRSNPRRSVAARQAAELDGADCFVLDDGFQHRRVYRQLDIALFDVSVPQCALHLLPVGSLREPLVALKRAGAVVLTHVDLCPKPRLGVLRGLLAAIARQADIAEAIHKPVSLEDVRGGKDESPRSLADKKVFAFCGIGNPAAFIGKLESLGARVAGRIIYPDHHRYTDEDAAEINRLSRRSGAEMCVTTQKDAVKIANMSFKLPVRSLKVRIEFISGEESLLRSIRAAVAV